MSIIGLYIGRENEAWVCDSLLSSVLTAYQCTIHLLRAEYLISFETSHLSNLRYQVADLL